MVEVDNPGFFYVFDLPAPILDEEKQIYLSIYLHSSLWCL